MAYQAPKHCLYSSGCGSSTTTCYGKTNWGGWICHDYRGVRDLVPTPVGSQGACIFNNNTDFDMKHNTYSNTRTHTLTFALSFVHTQML